MNKVDLVLTDVAGEEVADDILSALSDLAYSTNDVKVIEKRHKSRFFFVVTSSINDSIKKDSNKFKAKKLDHIDDVVVKRLKLYKTELPSQLSDNIKEVREFFLTVIGPRSLAGGAGTIQAKDIVQRMLNTEVDSTQFAKFDRMSQAAVDMVMAKFVAKFYGLPISKATAILAAIAPRPQTTVPIPNELRHEKNKQGKEQNTAK